MLKCHVIVFITGLVFAFIYSFTMVTSLDESEVCDTSKLDLLTKQYQRGYFIMNVVLIMLYIIMFIYVIYMYDPESTIYEENTQ